jgi:hypothetical protein
MVPESLIADPILELTLSLVHLVYRQPDAGSCARLRLFIPHSTQSARIMGVCRSAIETIILGSRGRHGFRHLLGSLRRVIPLFAHQNGLSILFGKLIDNQ